MKNIDITYINRKEAMRYMGYHSSIIDGKLLEIFEESEKELLSILRPKYVYRIFDRSSLDLPGEDIKKHLSNCDKVALICATISGDVDKLIRTTEISDMTKALVIDTMASVAVEQVCDMVEENIKADMPQYNMTWRYGVGYGDFPLEYQGEFIKLTNAYKQIGVSVTSNNILIPRKSVTCFIGLSKDDIPKGTRGCNSCNMKEHCNYRKRGEHCGF